MTAVPRSPLTPLEGLLWSLEDHDAKLRTAITVVALLDASPGIDHLRARVELLITRLPRLGQRIEAGPLGLTAPCWVADGGFDPAWHVRVLRAPEVSGLKGVLRLVEPLATEGIDRTRPPWQMSLVEGVDDEGGAALVLRLHHVYADGIGALRLAAVLFDGAPQPASLTVVAPQPEPTEEPAPELGPVELFLEAAGRSVAAVRRRLPAVMAAARDVVADPQPRAQTTVDLLRSVVRVGGGGGRPLSPLLIGRSIASRLGTVDVELRALAVAGRSAGGTVNDVFVAGVLDGLRRYHDLHGHRPDDLRIGLAINLRDGDLDDDRSNAFAPARIVAPLQILDSQKRIAAVHRLVLTERQQPAHEVINLLAGAVPRLPGARGLMASAIGALDVVASNVAGPPVPLWLGPARIKALYPFGPRSGAGLNLTLLSYGGIAHIGVHVDPAATPDTSVLLDCLRHGFVATVGGR